MSRSNCDSVAIRQRVETTTEELYEVLAGNSTGGILINHICETTDKSPYANTVRGYLTD